jgi:hypothetical protein
MDNGTEDIRIAESSAGRPGGSLKTLAYIVLCGVLSFVLFSTTVCLASLVPLVIEELSLPSQFPDSLLLLSRTIGFGKLSSEFCNATKRNRSDIKAPSRSRGGGGGRDGFLPGGIRS